MDSQTNKFSIDDIPQKEKGTTDTKILITNILKYVLICAIFIVLGAIYFYPVLLGESLLQNDDIFAKGAAQEITKFQETTGEYSAWTNSMFGGMPSYQIKSPETFNIHLLLQRLLHLGLPYQNIAIFFAYLIGFFVLLDSLKFKKIISVIGAIAFALSSYNIIIIAAGHITKCYAIAYMAPVLAGIIHCYNKNYVKGFIITALALGIEISCNHPQILYYLAILCGLYLIYKAIVVVKDKTENIQYSWNDFAKGTAVAAIAAVFAVLPNITNLWTTWEYGKYSTRSQSELSSKQSTSGLDKDYALAWSYGVSESFNLLIPDFKGGASQQIGTDEPALSKINDSRMAQAVSQNNRYWGDQPFTSGPVYIGAIIIFLFVLGLFIVENNAKWWLLAGTIASLVMSWGHNFGFITDLLFNYFPLYNKFRSVSMALVIAQVCIPFLAMLAVKELTENPTFDKNRQKSILISTAITAGLCLIFAIIPGLSGGFLSHEEQKMISDIYQSQPQLASQYETFSQSIITVRKEILKSDAWRSFAFIIFAAALIFFYQKNSSKFKLFVPVLGILIVFDLWTVDRRYLSTDDFQSYTAIENRLRPTPADEFITKDSDPNYRVLNLTANVFNDGRTSFFHKSIGGYHGAKMRRYQEFIDTLLSPTVRMLTNYANQSPETFNKALEASTAINMLNTKFIILNPNEVPYVNMSTYGNAWFVSKFDFAENADQEIGKLKKDDVSKTAIINKINFKDYISQLPTEQIYAEDSSIISLTEYRPNYISYNATAYRDRLAVFSEIYYPKGWTAYLDGKEVPHICADYILRAMVIPAGNHKVEFRFDPTSVRVGKIIATISSILLIASILLLIFYTRKNSNKNEI